MPERAKARVLQLCGLLSRPRLGPDHRAALEALQAGPGWQPVAPLSCFNLLLPLYRHHLEQSRLEVAAFLRPVEPPALPPPAFPDLALAWLRRRALQTALGEALLAGGVRRPMWVKGAALAPLYPAPALRQMCDADLVVSPAELAATQAVLHSRGWVRHAEDGSEVWRHSDSAMLLDLHVPEGPLAERILADAVPHPGFPGTFLPAPAAHLAILALHAANNGGNRIWRDACDAHAVMAQPGFRADDVLALAEPEPALRAPLAAFLAFLNRHALPGVVLPLPELSPRDSRWRDRHLALYTEFATEALSPAQLGLIKQTFRPFSEHLAALRRAFVRPAAGTPAERDPALGDLPPAGSAARQVLRLRFLGEALLQRRLLHYRTLAHSHTEVSRHTKLFRAPGQQPRNP